MKNLVIVESPAKAKTIEKYLGKGFKVLASMGHVRDLPKSSLGVDVDSGYVQEYEILKGKKAVITKLKKALPEEGTVYLAQDLDREGEAIAWHVGQAIGIFDENLKPRKVRGKKLDFKRIVFNEITKGAIQKAVANPRKVDSNLVEAQQARRVLDRLVGYKLSPLLWKKVRYGLSAGRVQSVAVRLIVDRERERDAFTPEEYWSIDALLYKGKKSSVVEYSLVKYRGEDIKLSKKADAVKVTKRLESSLDWIVKSLGAKQVKKKPTAPFITSTLQQTAYKKLGFTSKRTMSIAQRLYQGIDAGKEGTVALITYMRTDSTNLSKEAVTAIRKYVETNLSKDLLTEKPVEYKKKSKLAQEAHEAIRPAHVDISPSDAKKFLGKDELKLYTLIWNRAVASQMVPAEYMRMNVDVENSGYLFRAVEQFLVKPGYLTVYGKKKQSVQDNILVEGDKLSLDELLTEQHFTKPPARYNEASLVKDLEANGVGRPSTYASIISTILARGYVTKENKAFKPEDTGIVVTDLLIRHFPEIVDLDFTSRMEADLDNVAAGKTDWIPVVDEFYKPFAKLLKKKEKEIKKEDIVVLGDSDEKCELCGKKMIIKLGKYGRFLSCSDFPKCKGIKSLEEEDAEELAEKYEAAPVCPKCGGEMTLKTGRFGKFWACQKYPECKGVASLILKEKCPECGSGLVERRGKWGKTFVGCSGYPKCRYIKKKEKENESERE